MEVLTIIKASDGCTFKTIEECQDYEEMIAAVKKYESKYFAVPSATDADAEMNLYRVKTTLRVYRHDSSALTVGHDNPYVPSVR